MGSLRLFWFGGSGFRAAGRSAILGIVATVIALALLVALAPRLIQGETGSTGPEAGLASAGSIPGYAGDVDPIFQRTCVRCHGPDRADKGLRLDSYQRMMAGDSYGTVVIPGDSSLSAIVTIVRYGTMPHGGTGLPAEEIDAIARWIDAGAKND